MIKLKQREGQGGPGTVAYNRVDVAAISVAMGPTGCSAGTFDELTDALRARSTACGWSSAVDPADHHRHSWLRSLLTSC